MSVYHWIPSRLRHGNPRNSSKRPCLGIFRRAIKTTPSRSVVALASSMLRIVTVRIVLVWEALSRRGAHGVLSYILVASSIIGGHVAETVLVTSEYRRLVHSMNGFFWPPTMQRPRARNESRSLARITVRAGSMGLLGSTCEASFADCSIASISSLQPCWSSGQITIGCRRLTSLAPLSCTWET
jgi:hypothetical protein